MNIITFLSGKKTYALAFVLGALNLAVAFGWISPAHLTQINIILGSLGLGALRAGVAKSAPTTTPLSPNDDVVPLIPKT